MQEFTRTKQDNVGQYTEVPVKKNSLENQERDDSEKCHPRCVYK